MEQDKISNEELDKRWKEYRATNSLKLRDELITHYLYLVKHVVSRLAAGFPAHINIEDMYSTGIIGLIKAVEKFDPTLKNKFSTYAILLIKGAIIDEMRTLDWIPRSIHQKANMIGKAQQSLRQKLGREPTEQETADRLGIELSVLQELMVRVRPAVMISLTDTSRSSGDDDEGLTMMERIPDKRMVTSYEVADRNEFTKLLREAILELPEQERIVLVLYYYENLMLKEIGQVLGVSESRISQIHSKAVSRLRMRLKDFVIEFANMI